jgi:streptogramin lyase
MPPGQFPPNAVQVGVNSATGEQVFAVANNYVAQIDVTGLTGAAAANPTDLLHQAQGELLQAKLTNANDKALASVSITKYLGAGRFLMTAGTNDNLVDSPLLQKSLGTLPGFQSVIPDYLFPSNELKTTPHKPNPPPPPPSSPVPVLSEIGAPGGLVFSGSASQNIAPGTTISYSVLLDAGQTLAAIVTPDNNLQPTLTITDPKGKVLGKATGSAPGAMAAVQAIPIGISGTYHITVGGVGNSAGNFTVQPLVNTQLQNEQFLGGSNDNSLANAQQIDASSLNLGNGIMRSAVNGNIPIHPAVGDAYVSERGVGVQLVSSSGVIEATFNNPALSAGVINGMHIAPNGNLYVGVDTSPGNGTGGEIVEMTQSGTLVTTITLPNDPNQGGFFFYPFGFSVASDGTLWVAQPNTGNVVHLDASGNLIRSYSTGGNPEWTAVRSDGQVFISQDSGGTIEQLDPGSGKITTFATDPGGAPFGLSFASSGDLLVADPNVGVERFNSSGTLTQVINDFNAAIDAEADPSGNILVGTFFNTVDKFTSGGALIHSTSIPGNAIGLAVLGSEGAPPPPADTTDYYKFTLAKGQSATAALSDLGGATADVALVGPDGTVLALGKVINGSTETINSFIAPTKGTFYLRVTGNGVQYSLVLETGADISTASNTTLASAQNMLPTVNGVQSVLGSITSTSLWGVDWQNAPQQLIHTINNLTGAFTSTFSSPTTPLTNPFGFNMAFDGTNLWYNDGANFGSNTIFKLNPTSGAVLGSFPAPTSGVDLTGLAYLNGSLWGTDVNFNIYQINPSTGKLVGQFSLPGDTAVVGLAGDPGRGDLWAVSQSHTLYQIDPVKQTIIKSASDGLGLFEQDLGFFNNELYVSETNGPGFNDVAVFNASTLKETRDLPMNVATFISGLGADGFALTPPNYYHFSSNAGDKLFITATAPLRSEPGAVPAGQHAERGPDTVRRQGQRPGDLQARRQHQFHGQDRGRLLRGHLRQQRDRGRLHAERLWGQRPAAGLLGHRHQPAGQFLQQAAQVDHGGLQHQHPAVVAAQCQRHLRRPCRHRLPGEQRPRSDLVPAAHAARPERPLYLPDRGRLDQGPPGGRPERLLGDDHRQHDTAAPHHQLDQRGLSRQYGEPDLHGQLPGADRSLVRQRLQLRPARGVPQRGLQPHLVQLRPDGHDPDRQLQQPAAGQLHPDPDRPRLHGSRRFHPGWRTGTAADARSVRQRRGRR